MRLAVIAAVALAGCFDPSLGRAPYLCGSEPECPPGYGCHDGVCSKGEASADARAGADARPTADGRADGPLADAAPGPDAQRECDPAKPKACDGDDLITCSTVGKITSRDPCDLCLTSPSPHCGVLEPTNLPRDLCDAPATRPRRITADIVIDTDACADGRKITQGASVPAICLLEYTDFAIDLGVEVSATGAAALAIAADTMTINGYLDVRAIGTRQGSGASAGGLGNIGEGRYANGGGGAGHATPGGRGGTEDVLITVAGGPVFGNAELHPLAGGSPGGRAGSQPSICTADCPTIAAGGGGGGALQLVACKKLVFGTVAQVRAPGGGGAGGFAALTGAGGGGGGGSGGALLFESPQITIGLAAFFYATGGGGGGGGGLTAGERGGVGEDGQPDRAAQGGGRGSSFAGRGGQGGIRDASMLVGTAPGDGETIQKPMYGAGGGGGAAGRIRFNTRSSSPVDPRTFIVLPYPSVGFVLGH